MPRMPEFNLVQKILLMGIPILFAITVHEVAHGWVANKLGDPTARMLGRLTLNPIKHIDPVGTLLIPAALLLLGAPFLFGWAKPVPITPQNFAKPRIGMAWVAAAGPASNLLMAIMWVAVCWMAATFGAEVPYIVPLYWMGIFGVLANVALGVLNLFPLPPLDGSKVLAGFLPARAARAMYRVEYLGLLLVAVLLWTGILGRLLSPIIFGITNVLLAPVPELH